MARRHTESVPSYEPLKRTKRAVVGLGTLVLAGGIAACGGTSTEAAPSTPAVTHGVDQTDGHPQLPANVVSGGHLTREQIRTMDPAEAANSVTSTNLLDVYGPILDQGRQGTLDGEDMRPYLTPEQQEVFGDKAPTGEKANLSDQEVINEVVIDAATASLQPDNNEGQIMLELAYDELHPNFQYAKKATLANADKKTLKDKSAYIEAYKAIGPELPRPVGNFYGVDLTKYAQARLIVETVLPNDPNQAVYTDVGLYGLLKDGQTEDWEGLRTWQSSDMGFTEALNKLVANSR